MNHVQPTSRRRILAGLLPLALAVGVLPLLAPTCGNGQPGVKTFSRGSLIIPMDVCYQYQTDQVRTSYTPTACPQATDPGDVIKAYGLVYQLIRNNIAVYWIIDPAKNAVAIDAVDLTIQYNNGPPVLRYDWNVGGAGATAPTSGVKIDYRGGPFVVDGSDLAKASAVLQQYRATFGNVKVHVANVAFQGYVAKTMAGGWNAGGAVPPKLALLDIGSDGAGAKNSEVVIQGYLTAAGLDTAGAAGTATGTHGQIYDRLFMADFLPDATGDWKTTNLYKNGYQVLWVPHWAAPSSCSDCPPSTSCACQNKYAAATIAQALKTVGAFSAAQGTWQGGDVFAECAGLGSFEGVFASSGSTGSYSSTYKSGDPTTTFQTVAPTGVWINRAVGTAKLWSGNYASPFMQIGDYPFIPRSGAIQNYKPNAYKAETKKLISDATDDTYDIFTLVSRAPAHGTIVYLGGHSYSGTDGSFEIGGSRLVLNTLFNLGSGCVASGVSCSTGLLGVCGQGVMTCDASGQQVCAQVNTPSAEICDGLDNDCNGLVDDGLDTACYDGPPGSLDAGGKPRGTCHAGVSSCERRADGSYAMSACTGEVLPTTEVCNGLDDNCDGQIDENLSQACYTGPSDSIDPEFGLPRGACKEGLQTCTAGAWGACNGQVLPQLEACGGDNLGNGIDENCNGLIDEGCSCTVGVSRSCYSGPGGTAGVGACKAGTQTCSSTGWGPCVGEVTPRPEVCGNLIDDDCNAVVDDPALCNKCPAPGDPSLVCLVPGATRVPDPAHPGSTLPAGTCKDGVHACQDGVLGACSGTIAPAPETCDGKDNDCNGLVDDGATCADGFSCISGVCVRASCGTELSCPDGYACVAGACARAVCGTQTACTADTDCQPGVPAANRTQVCGTAPNVAGKVCVCKEGLSCQYGGCVDPCAGVTCGPGAVCASGACTGGSCYSTGCPTGQLCRSGACAADPCGAVTCPAGTFCRAGDCVQSCAFQTCQAGQRCTVDGFCEADPCAGKTCPAGKLCSAGACVADPCAGLGCGSGQTCQGGVCVDDPCSGVTCPAGVCSNGQCYASLSAIVGTASPTKSTTSGGCGCGTAEGTPLALLAIVLAAPLARRRRRAGGGALLGVAVVGAALLGSGCSGKTKTEFDPAKCEETCQEQRCVSLASDPAHCGTCGTTCAQGETCVTGVCGPSGLVAPYLRTLSPASAGKGAVAPVPVAITGDRLQAGASLRVTSPSSSRTYLPCDGSDPACLQVVDAGHATATLDLADSPTTELQLRVVNPDHVISNAVEFGVTTPSPVVAAVTPAQATVGNVSTVLVTGTGFSASSQCHLSGAALPEEALPSTVDAAGVTCTLDPSLQPGAYKIWIVNEGTLASNQKDFTVVSAVPHIDVVSPNSGEAGKVVSFSIIGTGLDAATTVKVNGAALPAGNVAYYGATELFVTQYLLPACDALNPCATPDKIQVHNSAGDSNLVDFYRGPSPPQVLSLSVTPQPLYQGQTATLTFAGSGFAGGTVIEVRTPAGVALAPITPSSTTATQIVGSLSLASQPEGLYTADLKFPGGGISSTFQFRVFSNVAVLQAVAPSGGAQGATISTVTVTGSNLRASAHVQLRSGATILQDLVGAYAPPDTLTASGLKVANLSGVSLDTGVYSLVVVNPGAASSNALSFSVTPGLPTLTSVSPATAQQQNALVPVTLTGTNFAKPDATGGGASTVMVAGYDATKPTVPERWITGYDSVKGAPIFVPAPGAVTVASSTQIQVQVDTRAAVPATYYVAVWNPGGNPPPQRSDAGKDPLTLPSFRITP